MKRCPPGVICIENVTIFIIIIIVIIVIFILYLCVKTSGYEKEVIIKRQPMVNVLQEPNIPYNNLPNDVLLDPYVPPLKDNRYLTSQMSFVPPGRVPINISTNIGAIDTSYRQVGILTPLNGPSINQVLPLMGRPLFSSRQKWQYYTISNQHNNVKLPVKVKGRSGTTDYGVDEVYSNDKVFVEGNGRAYKVTTYDNDTVKYLPFL